MAIIASQQISRGKFEPVRELAYGDLTNSFQMVGDTFDAAFYILFIQNFTDATIDFSVSYAGEDVTFTLASGGALTSDMISNSVQVSQGEAAWAKYRDSAPTSGFVQVAAIIPST